MTYNQITTYIISQFAAFQLAHDEYKHLEIYVDSEQNFTKHIEITRNSVHIVIHYNEASINFATSVCPITLQVLGNQNQVAIVQQMLFDYASEYNLKSLPVIPVVGAEQMRQYWRSPVVSSNFLESDNSFRNLYLMNGTIIIGYDIITITKIEISDSINFGASETTEIPFISFNEQYSNATSPQVFGNSNGYTRSEVKYGTYAFSISTYNINNKLVGKINRVKGFVKPTSSDTILSPNTDFYIRITNSNGEVNVDKVFKLVSSQTGQNLGDIPTIAVSFAH